MRLIYLKNDAQVAEVIGAQPLDVLFNCAGWVHQGGLEQCTDADWDLSFNLNVRAQWKTIAAALPGMLAQGGVKMDGEKVTDKSVKLARGASVVLQVGKRKYARVSIS